MKTRMHRLPTAAAFTLMEVMIVVGIIALLVVLMIPGGSGSGGGTPHRLVTQGNLHAIQSALEVYHERFGEYPEPVNADEAAEIMPGKIYRIGAARCLYQALTGDGSDAIKGVKLATTSDGKIDTDELPNNILTDMPSSLWRKIGGHYILVDGFGRPFQYTKAGTDPETTMNTTYDLWSFAEDEKHLTAKSTDTRGNEATGVKWITNW